MQIVRNRLPSDGSREKQLYLPIDTIYKYRTCTVTPLWTCTFQW